MTKYFIIPGLGNSGENHWQTLLEKSGSNFQRIQQNEWDSPDCEEWIDMVERAIAKENPEEVVLIGHSLGCATIAHWAARYRRMIKGAFMVAPSDVETAQYATFPTTGFVPFPLEKLPFKTVIVTSADDTWVMPERARWLADRWNSDFINIGNAGHINVASGHGEWKFGEQLLRMYFDN